MTRVDKAVFCKKVPTEKEKSFSAGFLYCASHTAASRENIYIFRMKSLTLMKSLALLVNEDGALHLMKRRRPHFSCSPIFIPSLAKRLHSFISPLGRLHFRRVTAMLQKTSLSTRAEMSCCPFLGVLSNDIRRGGRSHAAELKI